MPSNLISYLQQELYLTHGCDAVTLAFGCHSHWGTSTAEIQVSGGANTEQQDLDPLIG